MALLFDHKSCGRCGGSGRYSFNLMHGSVCYGCGGKGQVLTKKGRAAQNFLDDLRSRKAGEMKVGDIILYEGFSCGSYSQSSKWEAITEIITAPSGQDFGISPGTGPHVKIITTGSSLTCPADTIVRKGFTGEEKDAQRKAALEFQATLTLEGKVKKVRA